MEKISVDLKTLEGTHLLFGVDVLSRREKTYGENYEDVTVCLFKLDGTVYNVTENPDDGYRSQARECLIVDEVIKNKFSPVKVLCKYADKSLHRSGDGADILYVLNAETGKTILEIGTDNIDDYYPSYICNFSAEAIGAVK